MYSKIEDLHEELFHFLSSYSSKFKEEHGWDLTFLLRPEIDEAFQKGRWFYDDVENGYVNLCFTESKVVDAINNISITVYTDGNWNIKLHKITSPLWDRLFIRYTGDGYGDGLQPDKESIFWDKFIVRLINLTEITKENNQYTLYPNKSNQDYREALPKIIQAIYEFFNFEPIAKDFEDRITLIPVGIFRQLEYIVQKKIDYVPKVLGNIYLKSILIKNFHQIKNTSIQNLSDTNWIFLTGENGFGKTSLLRAIAIGLRLATYHNFTHKKDSSIELAYSLELSNKTTTVINNTQYPLFARSMSGVLACYGASRLEMQNQESQNKNFPSESTVDNLFNANALLKNIEYELLLSYYDNKEKCEAIVKMLKTLIPTLHHIDIQDRQVHYYEKDINNGKSFEPVSFAQLASGMRSIIAMAGDIYLRLVNHKSTTNYHPKHAAGIVIIDELDLHLHPKWQRALPGLLSKVFPKVQFIASTHSPIPLLGAPKGAVFLKVNRTTEEGVTVERLEQLEKEIHHLLPNAILTSDIFGLEDINAVTNEDLDEVSTADSYEDFKLEEALMKSLKIIKAQEGDIFKK